MFKQNYTTKDKTCQGLQKINICLFNMSFYADWQKGIRNRNYFILQELLKRPEINQIIAVDYLPLRWKQKIKVLRNRFKKGDFRIKNYAIKIDKKMTVFSVAKVNELLENLKSLITNYQLAITLVWSYFPLYLDYYDQIPAPLKIFDAVDDWSYHPSYVKYQSALKQNYQKIKEKADVIFTVSPNLREQLFGGRDNVFWVPNGVDYQLIRTNPSKQKSKLVIGYVGTIQSRVDFELVRYLAQRHSDKEFVFIGPVWKEAEIYHIKNIKNIKFVGRVFYDDLPRYLSKFSLGIIPHKIDDFTRSMDPLKFYEYLAAGLPVVSTQKIAVAPDLVYLAQNYQDFDQTIVQALREDNDERRKKRQRFARQNSWRQRAEEMLKIIEEFQLKKSF